MQSRLIVKNFGPIDFVDLDLRNVNVFIGPQASGKSALAKLYTIFKAPRKFLKNGDSDNNVSFIEALEEYNIASFLKSDTEIKFESEVHDLRYENNTITYEPKLLKKIQELAQLKNNFESNGAIIKNNINQLCEKFIFFEKRIGHIFRYPNKIRFSDYSSLVSLNSENFQQILEVIEEIENSLSKQAPLYIPSERNFINIIKNSSFNLLLNNVPIPKHILLFGAELEKAHKKEINLGFLKENLIYRNINGEDRIFTDDTNSIKLIEAASGIQSVLPILILILSRPFFSYHKSYVIEEPELNLFPIAQYELIKGLETTREGHNNENYEDYGTAHIYTTHSPYILSALNNLLFANKVIAKKGEDIRDRVNEIIPSDTNPQYFTAYQIKKGKAESIFDREKGLIIDNYIDDVADEMADDFDALTRLMK